MFNKTRDTIMKKIYLAAALISTIISTASVQASEVSHEGHSGEGYKISYAILSVDGSTYEYKNIIGQAPGYNALFYLENTTEETHVFSNILFDFGSRGTQAPSLFQGPITVGPQKMVAFFDSRQAAENVDKNISFVKVDGQELHIRETSVPSQFYVNNITLETQNDSGEIVSYKETPNGRTPVAYINISSFAAGG
ncbi:MAG: hypothetical protein GY915_09385 [bacterium]|nr:hypothetical protein [bacterium]